MMYIHISNEIDKRINVSKTANDISTMGDNSTAAGCNSRLITVLVDASSYSAETQLRLKRRSVQS